MPSSTSSSSAAAFRPALEARRGRSWVVAGLLALLLAAAALLAVEWYWRARGYQPTVIDSMQLWSIQRDRVYGRPRPLVLLGASRTEYSIDPDVLAAALPGYKPVMLSINAHYPLAVLRDLADDPAFRGVVLVDIDSNGLRREYVDMQQPWVDYYRNRWTPSGHIHRLLLSLWQNTAVIANPGFGAIDSLRYLLTDAHPQREFVTYYPDRHGEIDYRRIDTEAIKRHFERNVEASIQRLPPLTPQQWLKDLAPVRDWVCAIQARGGEVIFYQSPTSGLLREVYDRVYPRDQYWDRFAATSPAHLLNARDVPALAAFTLPDDSHIDYRDQAAYTRALADTLLARGWLATSAAPESRVDGSMPASHTYRASRIAADVACGGH